MGRVLLRVATIVAIFAAAACSADDPDPVESTSESSPAEKSVATSSAALPPDTPQLDSVAALGHSNLTGTRSDPKAPWRDARENSWATGENPQVQSIYRRLLADHPDLKGHNYNEAINGATIDSLEFQYDTLMSHAEVAPDIFLMQFIDNDIKCDGTDDANAKLFGQTLDDGLSRIAADLPNAQFYLTGSWASVKLWTAWAAHHVQHVQENSGTGPCDVFDDNGRPRPAGVRSMQHIIDTYREQMETVCSRHPGCYTDEAALETFKPEDRDVADDLNHLSIAGQRKYAEIAWWAMPDAIKERS